MNNKLAKLITITLAFYGAHHAIDQIFNLIAHLMKH